MSVLPILIFFALFTAFQACQPTSLDRLKNSSKSVWFYHNFNSMQELNIDCDILLNNLTTEECQDWYLKIYWRSLSNHHKKRFEKKAQDKIRTRWATRRTSQRTHRNREKEVHWWTKEKESRRKQGKRSHSFKRLDLHILSSTWDNWYFLFLL